jgi:hypothetical protein
MSTLEQELTAFIEEYISYSGGMRTDAKKAMWDQDDDDVVLKPEEVDTPLFGWAAIDAYWGGYKDVMSSLDARPRDIKVVQLNEDLAICNWTTTWIAQLNGPSYPKPIAGDVRGTAYLRRKPEGWRMFHYVEAPLGPFVQMRRAYERAFTDLFPNGFSESAS